MQPHLVHHLVHDESRSCHVTRIFHKCDEQVENDDVGQKNDHPSHPADNTFDKKVFQRTVCHVRTNEISCCSHQPFNTLHGIFAQPECGFKHKPHE